MGDISGERTDLIIKDAIAQLAQRTQGEARAYVEIISCRLGYGHASSLTSAEPSPTQREPEVCKWCHCPIERCLERRTGWKHKSPWAGPDFRCGGKAEPATQREPEEMSDEELDAELLANGITPQDVDQQIDRIKTAIAATQREPEQKENHMEGLLMKYFVLKPAGNDRYAAASRRAMHSYADFIREENPVLANELHDWAGREGAEAYAAGMEVRDEG